MKKILITGGAGFLGSHLSKRLLDEGNEVTAMDNLFTGNKSNIYDLLSEPKFSFILHDVTQPFWGQFDEIYNLACPASPIHYQKNPVETIKTSFLGMMNVLELALKTKAKVIHTSTSEIYGDPLVHPQNEKYWGNVNTIGIRSCYDEGKRCAETLCADYAREYNVDVRMLRIFNTYGPNMHPKDGRVISNFVMQALHNRDITIYGDGSQTRSFQYVEDLINAIQIIMKYDRPQLINKLGGYGWESDVPVFNVGNPDEFTIKELADKIIKIIPDCTSKIIFANLPMDDPKRRRPDISMSKAILGWEPKIKLDQGLVNTIKYFSKFK
jgi:UDP-glucuronate decarboxylase